MSKLNHTAAAASDTTIKTLGNGLTIIIREDHSAPVVSAQAWCRTGSIHEGKWLGAGLSHVLEHMLFKGTTTRPGSRIDQEVQEAGGYMNAYTSFDRTVYWINVPDTGARTAIDILADIMQHASLPADELVKELDVIRREMDMNQDDPGRRSSRRLFETAYTRSPYRMTVIGYPDIFNELKPEDIRSYYEERYAPNNLFFVVVGAVRTPEVIEQLEKAFSGSKARALPPVYLPEEPRQTAPRECFEEAAVELGHLHWSWHIPELRHEDLPALDLLAIILGAGRSSRLYQSLREKQGVVNSVDAWTYSPGGPGLFGVSAMLSADKLDAAVQAVYEEIRRVRESEVSPAEVAKALKQCLSATLSSRKTMQGQAQDLGGNWLAANDLTFSARYLEAAGRVTPADIRRVAGRYLTPENRTFYGLLPTGTAPKLQIQINSSREHPTQRMTLANGLRLLVKEDHRLPFVQFRYAFLGGVLAEQTGNNGITHLLSRMLLQGTAVRSSEELASEVESMGATLDTYGGNNSFGLQAEFLAEDTSRGAAIIHDVLRNPIFPPDAIEREKENQLAAIRSQRDHLLQSAGKLMRRTLFGEASYGLDSLGSEASVAGLDLAELKRAHAAMISPQHAVLAVYGDVDSEALADEISRHMAGWGATGQISLEGLAKRAPQSHWSGGLRRVEERREKKQAVVVMGFPGVIVSDPDRAALEVLQEACSDLGSRLFLRIREKQGLAYYVGAQHFIGLAPGYFAFYAGTSAEHAARVEEEFAAEVEWLRGEGLTSEEMNRAINKILGQRKIARQELGGLAMAHALDELYGLGFDYSVAEDVRYSAMKLEDVLAAARKYLVPERAVVATILPDQNAAES